MHSSFFKTLCFVAVSLSGFTSSSARAEAGEVLQGAAQIIQQSGEIAKAAIAASADKAVAAINAQANVEMTRIANDAVRDTNKTNETIALAQTYAAGNIAAINNAGATERQAMISTESILASKDKYASEREKAWMEYEYNVAKLLMEDKARQQQLQLEKEGRELTNMVKMLRPAGGNGGLEITRYDDSLQLTQETTPNQEATTTTTVPALAQVGTATATTAQDRLTRSATNSSPSMAQKLASFRGNRGATIGLPQLVSASVQLKAKTPTVRGSSATKLLAINDSPKTASLDAASLRAARRGFAGAAHSSTIGRGFSGSTHQQGGGSDNEGGGGHHHHSH